MQQLRIRDVDDDVSHLFDIYRQHQVKEMVGKTVRDWYSFLYEYVKLAEKTRSCRVQPSRSTYFT
jgi:hypothetical protein